MPHREVKDPILEETYGIYDLELAYKQLDDPAQCLEIGTTMFGRGIKTPTRASH